MIAPVFLQFRFVCQSCALAFAGSDPLAAGRRCFCGGVLVADSPDPQADLQRLLVQDLRPIEEIGPLLADVMRRIRELGAR